MDAIALETLPDVLRLFECSLTDASTDHLRDHLRYRREFAAKTVDAVAAVRGPGIRVVSIAAEHLREAELSDAAHAGAAEFVAIDQDPESLAVIRRTMESIKVETIEGSVRQILPGKPRIPDADLVYALRLFDYLPQPVAQRLTQLMLAAVRPGGVLLILNFLPGIADIGWMKASWTGS
jgi:SAM-dependent methyltransferase